MRNGACASVHASSVATALLAFDARVEIQNSKGDSKKVDLVDFFVAPGAAGPDNGLVDPPLCTPGRSCYQAPRSEGS